MSRTAEKPPADAQNATTSNAPCPDDGTSLEVTPMRFYVLCSSIIQGITPYIIAEVVTETVTETERDTSLAASLAGERAMILTRAELEDDPLGRHALHAWDAGNDAGFDNE